MKISFTSGTLSAITTEYYNLTLYANDKVVYRSTVPTGVAASIMEKHGNKISMA